MAALTTRLMKAECACGYIVRVSRKALDRGAPMCGARECPFYGEPMSAEYLTAQLDAIETGSYRLLKDKPVTLRSIQQCGSCRGEMAHGEWAQHRVYAADGEFVSEYRCFACAGSSTGTRSQGRAAFHG